MANKTTSIDFKSPKPSKITEQQCLPPTSGFYKKPSKIVIHSRELLLVTVRPSLCIAKTSPFERTSLRGGRLSDSAQWGAYIRTRTYVSGHDTSWGWVRVAELRNVSWSGAVTFVQRKNPAKNSIKFFNRRAYVFFRVLIKH